MSQLCTWSLGEFESTDKQVASAAAGLHRIVYIWELLEVGAPFETIGIKPSGSKYQIIRYLGFGYWYL